MRFIATLLPIVALGLPGGIAVAEEGELNFGTEEEARAAMNAWTTYRLAPELIGRCVQDFPDKASIYEKTLTRWMDRNAEFAWSGEHVYRAVTAIRSPGRDSDEVLAAGIARAVAAYDAKSTTDRLAHCDAAFLSLMVDIGPTAKGEGGKP